ncbi:hypothetical protein K0M31_014964, partial [Melipona bicolor]
MNSSSFSILVSFPKLKRSKEELEEEEKIADKRSSAKRNFFLLAEFAWPPWRPWQKGEDARRNRGCSSLEETPRVNHAKRPGEIAKVSGSFSVSQSLEKREVRKLVL